MLWGIASSLQLVPSIAFNHYIHSLVSYYTLLSLFLFLSLSLSLSHSSSLFPFFQKMVTSRPFELDTQMRMAGCSSCCNPSNIPTTRVPLIDLIHVPLINEWEDEMALPAVSLQFCTHTLTTLTKRAITRFLTRGIKLPLTVEPRELWPQRIRSLSLSLSLTCPFWRWAMKGVAKSHCCWHERRVKLSLQSVKRSTH